MHLLIHMRGRCIHIQAYSLYLTLLKKKEINFKTAYTLCDKLYNKRKILIYLLNDNSRFIGDSTRSFQNTRSRSFAITFASNSSNLNLKKKTLNNKAIYLPSLKYRKKIKFLKKSMACSNKNSSLPYEVVYNNIHSLNHVSYQKKLEQCYSEHLSRVQHNTSHTIKGVMEYCTALIHLRQQYNKKSLNNQHILILHNL